jgi:transcription antitermination factor NusG
METDLISAALTQTATALPLVAEPDAKACVPKWYAAYTSANHEKRVAHELGRRSVECYLPLYGSVRRWKDRRVRLELPLFPGYVFVRMAIAERLRVLQVPGVARLVGFEGHPAAVPDEDITAIRACLAGGHALLPHRYLGRGQRVRVLSGPLAGLTGVVVRQKKQARLVLSFDLLMRSVAVELEEQELCVAVQEEKRGAGTS